MRILFCFVIIIGVCALYALFSFGSIIYAEHYSKNPAIIQHDATLGTASRTIRYIAAGDSTAVGEGASNVLQTYPYRIAEHLALTNTVEYKNVAVAGATTQDLINTQLQQIINFNPDVITVSIGANDRTHIQSNAGIYQNFQTIITTLLSKTHASVYMTDVPNFYNQKLLPLPFVWLLEHQTKSLNPRLLQLENGRAHIIDIHNFGWDKYPDITQTISFDHFHPNDIGYENWANAFISQLPAVPSDR